MINRIKTFFGQNGMTTVSTTENTDAFGNVINSHSMITNLNNGQASTIFDNTNHFDNVTQESAFGHLGDTTFQANGMGSTIGNHFNDSAFGHLGDTTFQANTMGNTIGDHFNTMTNGNINGSSFTDNTIGNIHDHINGVAGHWGDHGQWINDDDGNGGLIGGIINGLFDND